MSYSLKISETVISLFDQNL